MKWIKNKHDSICMCRTRFTLSVTNEHIATICHMLSYLIRAVAAGAERPFSNFKLSVAYIMGWQFKSVNNEKKNSEDLTLSSRRTCLHAGEEQFRFRGRTVSNKGFPQLMIVYYLFMHWGLKLALGYLTMMIMKWCIQHDM